MNNTVLWEGKIAKRWGFFFTHTKYAWVYSDRIIIRKNSKIDSSLIAEVTKTNVTSVNFPEFGAMEAMLTGFKGFVIKYREGDKVKNVSFWAKGFGAYPNKQEMKKLTEAIATFAGEDKDKVADTADAFSFMKYMFILTPMMIGYFTTGLTGAILMVAVGFGALKVYESKKLSNGAKTGIIAGIYSGGCIVLVIITLFLGVGIAILQKSI